MARPVFLRLIRFFYFFLCDTTLWQSDAVVWTTWKLDRICARYSYLKLKKLDCLYVGAPIYGECTCVVLVRKGGNTQIYNDELTGKRRNKEHWTKIEDKFNYVYFNFLTCLAIFMYFWVCVLSKYKDVDAIWSKNSCLDTHPITIWAQQQQEIGIISLENCFHSQRALEVHLGFAWLVHPTFLYCK